MSTAALIAMGVIGFLLLFPTMWILLDTKTTQKFRMIALVMLFCICIIMVWQAMTGVDHRLGISGMPYVAKEKREKIVEEPGVIKLNYRMWENAPSYMDYTDWVTNGTCITDARLTDGEHRGFDYKFSGDKFLKGISSPYYGCPKDMGYVIMNKVDDKLKAGDVPVLALVCGTTDKDILGYVFFRSEMESYCYKNSTDEEMARYLSSVPFNMPNTVVPKKFYDLYTYVFESMHFTLNRPFNTDKDSQLIKDYDYVNRIVTIEDTK